MKGLAIGLTLLLTVMASGEDPKKATQPESPSALYYLDSSAQVVPLESKVVRMKQNYRLRGLGPYSGGGKMFYQVEGEKSLVRLKAEGKPEFVVGQGVGDPSENIQFCRFETVDGSRVAPIADFDNRGRMSPMKLNEAFVEFNAAKHGATSLKIVPIKSLAPGEYCLFFKLPNEWPKKSPGFCFGVDAARN